MGKSFIRMGCTLPVSVVRIAAGYLPDMFFSQIMISVLYAVLQEWTRKALSIAIAEKLI
jgi:hypothetical protein